MQHVYCGLNDAKNGKSRVQFHSWHIDTDNGECTTFDTNDGIENIHGKTRSPSGFFVNNIVCYSSDMLQENCGFICKSPSEALRASSDDLKLVLEPSAEGQKKQQIKKVFDLHF